MHIGEIPENKIQLFSHYGRDKGGTTFMKGEAFGAPDA